MLSKITKDIGIAGFGEFFYVLAIYATNVIISRYLGAEGVGIYAQAMAIIVFVSLLTRLGFEMGLLRFLSMYLAKGSLDYIRGITRFTFWLVSVTSVVLGAVLFVTADLVANYIFNEPELIYVLRILSLTIPFLAFTPIWLNAIQAFQRTDYRIFIGRVIVPGVTIATITPLLILGWDWNGILIGVLLATISGAILAFQKYHQLHNSLTGIAEAKPRFATQEWLLFNFPLFLSDLLVLVLARGTLLILGYYQDSATVGIYEIALKIALLVRMPLDISNLILAPIIGEIYTQGDLLRLQQLFKLLTKWIFTFSVLIFLLIIMLAEPILTVFGPEFISGTTALYILAFGFLVNVSTGAVGWVLIMSGYAKIHMLNSILSVLLTVTIGILLIPSYGLIGAAIAVSLVEILINIGRLAEVSNFVKLHPYRWDFIKPIAAGLSTLIVAYLVQAGIDNSSLSIFWESIILGGSICIVYLILSALLHWKQIKERRSLSFH